MKDKKTPSPARKRLTYLENTRYSFVGEGLPRIDRNYVPKKSLPLLVAANKQTIDEDATIRYLCRSHADRF